MATPVQFVFGMVNHFGLNLSRPEMRRLVKQYLKDRLEMEKESARQLLREKLRELKAVKDWTSI